MRRYGRNCEYVRPFRCDIRLVEPQLPCSDFRAPADVAGHLHANASCQLYSVRDEVAVCIYLFIG